MNQTVEHYLHSSFTIIVACVSLHRCLFSFSLSDRRRSRLSEDTRWNTTRTRNNAAGLGRGSGSGLQVGLSFLQLINKSIPSQPTKDFYIRLAHIDNYNEDIGTRTVTLEVNGEKWFIQTPDTLTPELMAGTGGACKVRREKSDPTTQGVRRLLYARCLGRLLRRSGSGGEEGQALFKLSAMKMESAILAPISGTVKRVLAEAGGNVEGDDLLAEIE